MKTIKILILLISLLMISSQSFALFNPITYLNYLQDLQTAYKEAQQVQQQMTALQYQAKNLGTVSDYQWQNVTQLLHQMDNSMQQGKAISFQMSDVDRQFRQRYPNYTHSSFGKMNYSNAYKNWNDTTLDTLRNTLSVSSIDAQNTKTEEQTLEQLKAQGRSATGRMQALQVSTELAGENVDQLMQLRHLMMAQMSAQNTYMAYQVSKDSFNEQALDALASHVDTKFPKYRDNANFGIIRNNP